MRLTESTAIHRLRHLKATPYCQERPTFVTGESTSTTPRRYNDKDPKPVDFAAKARVSPLGSPSVMNMIAPLVRRMFAFAYKENKFVLFQMKDFGSGTGQALLRSPNG